MDQILVPNVTFINSQSVAVYPNKILNYCVWKLKVFGMQLNTEVACKSSFKAVPKLIWNNLESDSYKANQDALVGRHEKLYYLQSCEHL